MVSTTLSPIQTSQLHSQSTKKTAAPARAAPASPLLASPFKRKTMSITQTYYLAHKARAKLSAEAQRPDHDLRKLVGSANLLDALMLDLADAEREQESWFNQSVRGATKSRSSQQERRVQWADSVIEEPEEDWEADDAASDSSSDSDNSESDFGEEEMEDVEMADAVSLSRIPSAPAVSVSEIEEDDEFLDDDEDDYAELSLTRSSSHSATSPPPELGHDSDDSDDESMPPSPPTTTLPSFSEKQQPSEQEQEASSEAAFYDEGYYLPPRNPARLVSAISVY